MSGGGIGYHAGAVAAARLMTYQHYAIYCLVLVLAHLVQTVTGFGSIALSLPLIVYFTPAPLKELTPALVFVNLFHAAWVTINCRREIDRKHGSAMLGLALLGMPVGYLIYRDLPVETLKLALGVFVTVVAIYNLLKGDRESRWPVSAYLPLNFLGGIAHGAMAVGGPFLVIYASRTLHDKGRFRATMTMVWTALNLILVITHAIGGSLNYGLTPLIGLAFPCVIVGNVIGMRLHDLIPLKPFRVIVFSVLLISGAVLVKPLVLEFLKAV